MYDIIIENGLFFDGLGNKSNIRHIAIKDGIVALISEKPIHTTAKERINAEQNWVAPGFIDFHTHYDAEIEFDPSLSESLRHGITTVFLGSCSLSGAIGDPEDIADIFPCRSSTKRSNATNARTQKDPNTFSEMEHQTLSSGPNVAFTLGIPM